MQVDFRKTLFDRAEHIFVELDPQIRVQPALQQHARPAQLEHLLDFFVDRFERQDVAVFGAERAVKRAERAIFGAEIRVIDVAVDLVGGDARVGLRAAHFIGRHADADQVIGVEKIERFLRGEAHRPAVGAHDPIGAG